MRKLPTIALTSALVVALAATVTPASAATSTSPLGKPQAGTLAENGGPAGFASINGLAAANGQTASQSANQISTSVQGATGKVTVANGSATVTVNSVLGDGTATETLQATNTQIAFKDAAPPFFTVDDVLGLMPDLTFTYYLRMKGTGALQYKGHYALNVATGALRVDDANTNNPANGHAPMKLTSDNRLTVGLSTSSELATNVSKANKDSAVPGTTTLNSQTGRVYQGYAQAITFKLGSATVPFSFGASVSGLTNGQTATLDVNSVLTRGGLFSSTWVDNLASGSTTKVPITFSSFDWKPAFNQTALNEIAGTSVEKAFNSTFGKGLDYDQLVSVIKSRSDAAMAADVEPMVKEFLDKVAADVKKSNISKMDVTLYPNFYGQLQMDNLYGTTSWPSDVHESTKTMYPTLKADTAAKIVKLIKGRADSQWYKMVKEQLSGPGTTATITKSLTPTALTSLTATNVTVVGGTANPTTAPTTSKKTTTPPSTPPTTPPAPPPNQAGGGFFSSIFATIISLFTNLFSGFFNMFHLG